MHTTYRRIFLAFAALSLATLACEEEESDHGGPGRFQLDASTTTNDSEVLNEDSGSGGSAGSSGSSGSAGSGGSQSDMPEVGDNSAADFIVVQDKTKENLAMGTGWGPDIDAIKYECSGESGYAIYTTGRRNSVETEMPLDRGLGEPDGPCNPISDCSVSTGLGRWLAFGFPRNLSGCTVTIYELSDRAKEEFDVHHCPVADINNPSCSWNIAHGTDGQTLVVEIQ